MKQRTEVSMQLYKLMLERGYPEEFCDIITKNLNTDFTAQRMIGYLYHYDHPPVEEIADEMISILSDRNQIMEKKEQVLLWITVRIHYLVVLHLIQKQQK